MRTLVIAGLLVFQQVVGPLSFLQAQVDPCDPVQIPGLCEPINPKPPKPPGGGGGGGNDKPGGGGGGGGGGGQNDGGGGSGGGDRARSRPRDAKGPEPPPFSLGGPKNTSRLVEILTGLTRYGIPLRKSLMSAAGPFPVAGLAWWTNDWHACRDGCSRFHKGLDIFAESGTPLVAAADGVLTQKGGGGLAGLHVEIQDAAGTQYFYAHLSRHEGSIQIGDRVEVGQVVGYVGNTGNAITTPSHVHFEYQPNGVPHPPKPMVDRWLRIAERRAMELVREHAGEEPISLEDLDAFRLTRLFDLAGTATDIDEGSARLLLLAGLQPAASSLEVTRWTVDEMAWEIDWRKQIDEQVTRLAAGFDDLHQVEGGGVLPFLGVMDEETQDSVAGGELGD